MSVIHTFVVSALAIEAIGAHLPTFPRKLALCPDEHWDIRRQDDAHFLLKCNPDVAMNIVKLLQGAARSPLANVEKTKACIEAAALIVTQLRRGQARSEG